MGVGATRIRSLFQKASAPSIIFIDEIDAIATRRDVDHREVSSTLNQLLVEMNGFNTKKTVLRVRVQLRKDGECSKTAKKRPKTR